MSKPVRKVLIVEDETTVQGIITAFLQRHLADIGVTGEIRTMSDPVQGLFELTSNGDSYDLILLDERMPKLTGDEIYNSLVYVNPDLLKRVVFVTGFPEDLRGRWPDEERAPIILQKPFRYKVFCDTIAPIVQRAE